jgi:hypothetical protein
MSVTGKAYAKKATAQQADSGSQLFFALLMFLKRVEKLALPALGFLCILHPLNHERETLTG